VGLAVQRRRHDRSQKLHVPEARREALEKYQRDLMRVRLELAELKRIGSQQGLPELTSEARTLLMRIKRFETIMIPG
jgi:hypothetical protein